MKKSEIDAASNQVARELLDRIKAEERVTVVKAPPGSGKTHLLVEVLAAAAADGRRIAVATPTNAQSEEVCDRINALYPDVPLIRFLSSTADDPDGAYAFTNVSREIAAFESGIVVATVSKWGFVKQPNAGSFDYMVVEEAWQVKLADFLPLLPLASRFVFIGDPGQIEPVVTIDSARWSTSSVGPQRAIPDAVLELGLGDLKMLHLPATRRLPMDTAELVQNFYDFPFHAYAGEKERRLEFTAKASGNGSKQIWTASEGGSVVAVTLDQAKAGGPPPLEGDRAIAKLTSDTIQDLIAMKPVLHLGDGKTKNLEPGDIGIASTRRAIVQDLKLALPLQLQDAVRVETSERWQGLERPVMFAVHPLSSVIKPTTFDLETGRLCVMASRHKVQLFVMTRDHIATSLDEYDPPGDHALGNDDSSGRGHSSHLRFIDDLRKRGVWIKAA